MTPSDPPTRPLPYLTAELPGVGGLIKRYDEDFVVEELPLYLASGEGTHTYLTIEKRGLTTLAAIELVARALGRQPRDIGYAGLKDAHGITRQRLSVEHVDPALVESLSLRRVRVVNVERHRNKIKLGHLRGNRFVIRIREAHPDGAPVAQSILDVLARRGVPNYFGPQRFGARGDNAAIGRAALRGDYLTAIGLLLGRPGPVDHGPVRAARELFDEGDWKAAAIAWASVTHEQARVCRAFLKTDGNARQAWQAVHRTLRRLYLSAVQSELFNQVLARRVSSLDRLQTGDVAWKHQNGACFLVLDATAEQLRCDALEISPTGPLFGRRMTEALGQPGELEQQVLSEAGLSVGSNPADRGITLDGARRPLRVPLQEIKLEAGHDERGSYLELGFTLPAGAYATSALREVQKTGSTPAV